MDTDKIIQDLNRRFAAPLPEFYQRRIIFWYDEDKEFEDKLDEVVLENAKVIALTGNNAFSVKKLLSVDDLTTNYLVYSPLAYNRPDDNWLLDVELYSEEFRADLISIWMDENVISYPTVSTQITDGSASITGNFTLESATDLANKINGGALPFKLETENFRSISATLGMGAKDAMVLAGAIAFVLVAVFVIVFYRLPGAVAAIALLGQLVGTIAALTGFFSTIPSFTLTLPGIAGIILSLGVGVDANIITAERIKEELKAGKSLDNALNIGYKRGFTAIFDGNITVIFVAVILMGAFGPTDSIFATLLSPVFFAFGASTAGTIYSFGYTLLVGIIMNFIMGVTASRLMLKSISRFKPFRKAWLYGGDK